MPCTVTIAYTHILILVHSVESSKVGMETAEANLVLWDRIQPYIDMPVKYKIYFFQKKIGWLYKLQVFYFVSFLASLQRNWNNIHIFFFGKIPTIKVLF